MRQAEVLGTVEVLTSQVHNLLESVSREVSFRTQMPKTLAFGDPLDLPVTPPSRVPAEFMRPTSAAHFLAAHTGHKWTNPKLHDLAKRLGWRPADVKYDMERSDHRYFTVVTTREGFDFGVYTPNALDYVLDRPDECWQIATSKETR
jgi:hypothetical protein